MPGNRFFGFTKAKLIAFIALVILMNVAPREPGVCVDGLDFGYCIASYGLPFPSFITGEVGNIPSGQWPGIVMTGIVGFVANTVIAYLVISVVFFAFRKPRKK